MISEQIIKKEFVRQILERDSEYIRAEQEKVIQDAGLVKTGFLSLDIRGQSGTKNITR